jgi:hypothetical protein
VASENTQTGERERDARHAYSPLAAAAEQEFRTAIMRTELRPYIRHYSTGEILSLPAEEWQGCNALEGFHTDYVGPDVEDSETSLLLNPAPTLESEGSARGRQFFSFGLNFRDGWTAVPRRRVPA